MENRKYFDGIKKALTKAPVLAIPYFSKYFFMFSFASQDTVVGVLLQKNPQDLEQPISFLGRN